MKNYISDGVTLTLAAPYAVASGAGMKVGNIFGVAQSAAAISVPVPVVLTGVYDLPKAGSQAWTVGATIYWDDTAKVCTTTAASNLIIGLAVLAVGSGAGETVGRVRLQPR